MAATKRATDEPSLEEKIGVVNKVLKTFSSSHNFTLLREDNTFYLEWNNWKGKTIKKRWHCGRNFYPSFYHEMGTGGTVASAIANLVKYCQGRGVYPLSTWRRWAEAGLWSDKAIADESIRRLEAIGYPATPVCIFCQAPIQGGWDWFDHDRLKKAGAGCIPSCHELEEWQRDF